MTKKEAYKPYPERDLATIILIAAVLFACAAFAKNNFISHTTGNNMQAFAASALPGAYSITNECTTIPIITYVLLLLLVIILITCVLRKHFIGPSLHTRWTHALYALLVLSILLTVLEYFICQKILYPAIFAIIAISIVFIFNILLTLMALMPKKKQIPPRLETKPTAAILQKPKPSIFDKLRQVASAKPAQPGEKEIAELKQVIKELKELKRK